jgi:hypothetical protein
MQIPGFTANWSVYDRGDDGAANSPRRGGFGRELAAGLIQPASSGSNREGASVIPSLWVDPKCCFCWYDGREDKCFCHPPPCAFE